MKSIFKCSILILISLLFINFHLSGIDTLKYSLSVSVYRDLSDTYNGGTLFPVELRISKSWYGLSINYGHFQSSSNFNYQVYIEDINKSVSIPVNEISIMKLGSFSVIVEPVNYKWISMDLVLGLVIGKAQSSRLNSINYGYNIIEDKFTYLYKDYLLIKKNHIGYQGGIDIKFTVTQHIGIEFKSRIQQLSNGGSFFLIGTGLCFNL